MKASILLSLAILTLPMGKAGMEAMSALSGLQVYQGTFIYLNGTKNVAIKAKGKDFQGYDYQIRCRWKGGVPVEFAVGDMEVGL